MSFPEGPSLSLSPSLVARANKRGFYTFYFYIWRSNAVLMAISMTTIETLSDEALLIRGIKGVLSRNGITFKHMGLWHSAVTYFVREVDLCKKYEKRIQ